MLEAIADAGHPRGLDDLPVREGNEAQRDVEQECERYLEGEEPCAVAERKKKFMQKTNKQKTCPGVGKIASKRGRRSEARHGTVSVSALELDGKK